MYRITLKHFRVFMGNNKKVTNVTKVTNVKRINALMILYGFFTALLAPPNLLQTPPIF